MKEQKRKMRRRDHLLIWGLIVFGVAGAGFMIWLNSKVDEWDLDKRPEQTTSVPDPHAFVQRTPSETIGRPL